MTQPIWYDSTEAGAPSLNNAAGTLLEVLRACLVNGFGAKTVTSISVSAGVATATAAAHGFTDKFGKLVLIAGATEPLLNGRKQPLSVSTNSFTFAAPGVADGTYTGSMSARRAPLGWTEEFNSGNVSIFKRTAPESTLMKLRVNDSGVNPATAHDARVVMVESATDANSFLNESPTETQLAGGMYWFKGVNSVVAKPWAVFGDDRIFYIVLPAANGGMSESSYALGAFGDPGLGDSPDPYGCILAGANSSITSGSNTYPLITLRSEGANPTAYGLVFSRSRDGATKSVRFSTVGFGQQDYTMGHASGGQTDISQYRLAGGAMLLEESTLFLRGELPGIFWPLARQPLLGAGQFASVNTVSGSDKKFISVLAASYSSSGNIFFDVVGPWR